MKLKIMLAGGLMAASVICAASTFAGTLPDHREFEATLQVPFRGPGARPITLQFAYPGTTPGTPVAWEIALLDRDGLVLRRWEGQSTISHDTTQAQISWNGKGANGIALSAGYVTVRMRAIALDNDVAARIGTGFAANALQLARTRAPDAIEEQSYDVLVGQVAPAAMPVFKALPRHHGTTTTQTTLQAQSLTASGLPYTIYYGNLHSQTNHSDGGGDVATCTHSQNPQSGAFGPADAYQYAANHGLDLLVTSEHNHMYDGSTGTNSSANPATAHNLYQSGLQAASTFNAAHPGFLAVYGMEWGVISNGGHLNIFNSPSLLEWEYNGSNQLIGDIYTAKSDYAALYAQMKVHGWIGQFNHPASTGQFLINGVPLGYSADGDQVMVLAEVLNSSAFSNNTTETETSRSSYETAFNKLLENGYHVAPSSDQDNHCANWGASFTNRTGVLIPDATTLNMTSFLDALRARRVFATEDKHAQIVLVANGHVMGERFNNTGPLTLTVNYASSNGHTVQRVQVFEGVPGSAGAVTTTSETAATTITPAPGEHFYYAKITQDNGLRLWSAPIWVTESSGGGSSDTTSPTVSAAENGSAGTITLSANASDNVGVTRVEFYVDNVLKASDTSAPYQVSLDSTTLTDGSHSLIAKAHDAAGNVGNSTAVNFSIANGSGGTITELIQNGGFENGTTPWTQTSGVISNSSSEPAHAGSWKAWLDGYGSSHSDYARQKITVPAGTGKATLSFFMHIDTAESTRTTAYDTMKAQVITGSGSYVTLGSWSNLDASSGYVAHTLDLSRYAGQTIQVNFYGTEDVSNQTSFVIDDVSVKAQ